MAFFQKNKFLCILGGLIALCYLIVKTGLGKSLSNVGGVLANVTGIAKTITGAISTGVSNVANYFTGTSANAVPGYVAGAWAKMLATPVTNPFTGSTYVPGGGTLTVSNSTVAQSIYKEISSIIYVSPSVIAGYVVAIASRDDVWDVINQVDVLGAANITDYEPCLTYFQSAMSTDWQDAIAGNILLKPISNA